MSWRLLQQQLDVLARGVLDGTVSQRKILVEGAPGGGKSLLPIILAARLVGHVIDGRLIEGICWVVPRISLQIQAVDNFLDPYFRQLLGHDLKIRQSTNDRNPSRGLAGHATTHAAVEVNNALLIHEFTRKGYLLVIDEGHHVYEGSALERALTPLVNSAALVMIMTGTLMRNNKRQAISFIPYLRNGNVRTPIRHETPEWQYIRYTIADALRERALKHLEFELLDGRAQWFRGDDLSEQQVSSLLDLDAEERSAALYTVLSTEWAQLLLERTVKSWEAYRIDHPRAKLLVVAANQPLARKFLTSLRRLGVRRAEIATSDETEAALKNIDRFKKMHDEADAFDALVTVAMAYEGLDVPSITHVACLTHIRSIPWILQMLARAQRVDRDAGPALEQRGFIFAPRDDFFDSIVRLVLNAQASEVIDPVNRPGTGPGPDDVNRVIPQGSDLNGQGVSADTAGERLDETQYTFVSRIRELTQLPFSPIQLDQLLRAAEQVKTSTQASGTTTRQTGSRQTRPNEEEDTLRQDLEKRCRWRDSRLKLPYGTTNGQMFGSFGKGRPDMTIGELRAAELWLNALERRDREREAGNGNS